MGAKEFFTAIGMLETYNKIMSLDAQKPVSVQLDVDTREMGRYRSYVYREKLLRREILELTKQRIRLENSGVPLDRNCSRSHLIDLWLDLSKVMLKKRRLLQQLELIPEGFVKNVIVHRYFNGDSQRLHTWAQTACELGLPVTGVQLRSIVTIALKTGEF